MFIFNLFVGLLEIIPDMFIFNLFVGVFLNGLEN